MNLFQTPNLIQVRGYAGDPVRLILRFSGAVPTPITASAKPRVGYPGDPITPTVSALPNSRDVLIEFSAAQGELIGAQRYEFAVSWLGVTRFAGPMIINQNALQSELTSYASDILGVTVVVNSEVVEAIIAASNAAASAANATGNAETATTKAAQAATSATNAAASESNAAGSASTATTKAAQAATSATNAAASESNAAGSASTATTKAAQAATSATNAAASESNAAGSASTATTKAAQAATSAANAATSATNAAASESNAAGSASTATTKAAQAATSATNAATSESNAAGSATAAAGSATAAAGSASTASAQATLAQQNRFRWRGNWTANTDYLTGDAVYNTSDGSSYRRKTDGNSGATFDAANWDIFAAKGTTGSLSASAFPEVNNSGGITDATYAVLQQGTTLQRIPLNALPIRMNSIVALPSNITQDLRGLLFSQYTDIFQGRILDACEKWNTGTSAWDTQNATVSLSFQKLFAGRPFLASQTNIYAGEKYRLTMQADNSSDGTILALYLGYFAGAVGFPTTIKVTIETSNNAGSSYTTRLAETSITFTNYYYLIPADLTGNRVRITLEAVGTAGSNFALHGIGGFGGKSSNQGRYWNRLPFGWNWKQYASFGTQANDGPPDCAALEVRSTDAGFLLPRMTVGQRNAIASPQDGLMGYQTDNITLTPAFFVRVNSAFHRLLTVNETTGQAVIESPIQEGSIGSDPTAQTVLHLVGSDKTTVAAQDGIMLLFRPIRNRGGMAGIATVTTDANKDNGVGLRFYTNSADSQVSERMRLDTAGNLGIGTTLPTSRLHVKGAAGHNQVRLETPYTPTSSADTNGQVGNVCFDDNFMYYKTSTGWKRAALQTF